MADINWVQDKEKQPWIEQPTAPGLVKMWGIQRLVSLDALMACWGLGTWLGVNGLYVQLPLLVERLPEGWALPSSMALAVQLANVGLLIYALLRRIRPAASDAPYVYILLVIGTTALTLNAFFYTYTSFIGENEHSLAFLILTFFAALVGCTSSVLFYPYLRHYREIYLATYLAGEGLSGFIPSIMALIQGVGGDPECLPSEDNSTLIPHFPPPRFGTDVFFLILAGLSALSFVSFMAVDNCSLYKSERVSTTEKKEEVVEEEPIQSSLCIRRWISMFALMALLNAISNGMLPSIQSFSCMPYGATAYHLAATLGAMANPAACLAGVWLRPVSERVLRFMLLLTLPPLAYILTTALMSPYPPLHDHPAGVALVVISWVMVSALVSYSRMWVYGAAREGGTKAMRVCGVFVQVGSALGSLLFFLLVNYTQLFTQSQPCPSLAKYTSV